MFCILKSKALSEASCVYCSNDFVCNQSISTFKLILKWLLCIRLRNCGIYIYLFSIRIYENRSMELFNFRPSFGSVILPSSSFFLQGKYDYHCKEIRGDPRPGQKKDNLFEINAQAQKQEAAIPNRVMRKISAPLQSFNAETIPPNRNESRRNSYGFNLLRYSTDYLLIKIS